MELSDTQRERIEKNRQAAKKRLAQNLQNSQSTSNDLRVISSAPVSSPDLPRPSKRFKNDKEAELFHDMKEVAHEGTVVRVQGSKLIDTGGGFFLEEKDLLGPPEEVQAPLVPIPAPIIPTDAPICVDCHKEFVESFLLRTFDYDVCDGCKDMEEKHVLITRTDAKKEYLLKDVDFDRREPILKFISRPNPHNPRWGDMKLYLRLQIEKRAVEIWGSIERIKEEEEKREENRCSSKIKKYNKKMDGLRKLARSSLFKRNSATHIHTFGPESYNEEDDTYTHTCSSCGAEETYEKM